MKALAACLGALALLAPALPAQAASSANVEVVASLPELSVAISLNFIDDTLFVSTVSGVFSYDVSDPANPRPLGSLPMYIWENEDIDVDPVRKRIFVARDPRGFNAPLAGSQAFPGAVHVIDVSDPRLMREIGFFLLPAGHTTTCVNGCDFLWTGGPLPGAGQPADWTGRPIFATDVRDPANPVQCPDPIDTGRNDGVTAYAHDVQVDSAGVAWVSGQGGVRGYWTGGEHRNPLTGAVETATACKPTPYAGSGTPVEATPSRFMHNSLREPVAGTSPRPRRARCARNRRARGFVRRCKRRRLPFGRAFRPDGVDRNRVLYATEEAISGDCARSGRFVTYDLEGTFGGEGFKDIAQTKHRMQVLDTWTPQGQEGSSGCASAHYFTRRPDGVLAISFYEQGVRFLDVSNPRDIRQIGWYLPSPAFSFGAYWHDGLAYVADVSRGVEILRFGGSPRSRTLPGPAGVRAAGAPPARMDPDFAYLCPIQPRL